MGKGLRILAFSFEDTNLTHFGGLVLIQRFCQHLRLRWRLQRDLAITHRGGDFQPADLILALLYVLIAGLRRISKTEILQYNGVFLSLLSLERFPYASTLRRFLHRMEPQAVRQLVRLHDRLRARLSALPKPRSGLVFDLDSVVLTVYGQQQGARVGYNPKKKGRRSYHPLLCFESQRQEFWHGSFRPGNAAANTGAVRFLERCLAKVPPGLARSRIRLRADSGFFDGHLLGRLEKEGCGYAVVAKQFRTIRQRAQAARFQKMRHGWETAAFTYQAHGWPKARRFVVIRRPIPAAPEEAAQLTLFRDRRYVYEVLVTNLPLSPWRVWRFYAPRATIEKTIRELLYDLPLNQIPTRRWVANVAFFHMMMLAYNLVHWFKRLCLPTTYANATVETVRREFLAVPGRLTRPAGRHVLQMPCAYPLKDEFLGAAKQLARLRLPKNVNLLLRSTSTPNVYRPILSPKCIFTLF
jgi:hypothetical protein